MTTKKTAQSAAKSPAKHVVKASVSGSKLAAVGRTKSLPRKAASAKASRTTLTHVGKQARRKGQSTTSRSRKVTAAQPAARVSAQRLASAPVSPVELTGLDKAIKELQRLVSRATNLTVGKRRTKVLIDEDALVAIKQVISSLSSTRDSLLIEGEPDIELTSQEVADMLNVSRPYVVKLAREGELSHKMVGNRHRFLLSAVREYESRRRVERDEALAAIVPEAGYAAEDF